MGTIVSKGQDWVLTIPKAMISEKEIQKIVDLLNFHDLVKDSTMTERDAWQLSEDLKADWWQVNKDRIMAKINAA
jgi:retron-type reverse transcriptase